MQDSLYVIRSEIGNQCSALRSGLVCSCREDLRINLVDAFWIFGVYVEDIQGRPQGNSYCSLSETGRGILLGFWLRPLSSTV